MNKETVGRPTRKIRVPIGARQHIETYKGIPVIDAFYTAGWVQEEDGTFKRYLAPTTHTEAIVLNGPSMNFYTDRGEGMEPGPASFLLLTGNRLVKSKPEIYSILSSEENDQFVEYGVDPLDFRIVVGILGAFGLVGEHGELPETDLKSHADKVKGIIATINRIRSTGE